MQVYFLSFQEQGEMTVRLIAILHIVSHEDWNEKSWEVHDFSWSTADYVSWKVVENNDSNKEINNYLWTLIEYLLCAIHGAVS